MNPSQLERIERLFVAALEQPPAQRTAYVAAAMGGDPDVSRELLSLLEAHEGRGRLDSIADRLRGLRPAAASVTMADLLDRLRAGLTGRYRIERELGRGGMAIVLLAEDLKHQRRVALKVLQPDLAARIGRARFLQEISIVAHLAHPHILPLHDSGEAGGLLYYVMPYVEGESLRHRLRREGPLPLAEALQITREVADALSYAHRQGVVHRDVKPANILFEAGHAVVSDFGIARAMTSAGGVELHETGIILGTPAYMSPEQRSGERDVDERSDVYSLGCVLYEMLADLPSSSGAAEVEQRTILPAGVPKTVNKVIRRAMARRPEDRFATALEFVRALEQRAPWSRWAPRWAAVGVLALTVAVVGVFRARPGSRAPRTAIAVLPFQNLSADTARAFFAGGLHDELLTQLTKVAALRVVGGTSVRAYTGTSKSVREIGEELGVGSLVEGSVQAAGSRLRVTVQLVDPQTGEELWAEQYDRTLEDAFAVQGDIARSIVIAVGAKLTSAEAGTIAAAPTPNADAYQLYLQGSEYWRRLNSSRADLEIAQRFLERAVVLDSTFALAHAALSLLQVTMWPYDPSPARAELQRREAQAAVRFGPDLPRAHLAMGRVHLNRTEYDRALEEFNIARRGAPNDALIWHALGQVNQRLGQWDSAEVAFEHASQLEPRDPQFLYDLGWALGWVRRHREAIETYRRALALWPDFQLAHLEIGWTLVKWQGNWDTLRAVVRGLPFETLPDQHLILFWYDRQPDSMLAFLRTLHGRTGEELAAGFRSRASWAGSAFLLRGDSAAARAAFRAAQPALDSLERVRPDDWRVHQERGMALAYLAHRADALREAHWLDRSYRRDPAALPVQGEACANILVQLGETDTALAELEPVLASPGLTSVYTLARTPDMDPVRNDPRFRALLVKYSKGGAAGEALEALESLVKRNR